MVFVWFYFHTFIPSEFYDASCEVETANNELEFFTCETFAPQDEELPTRIIREEMHEVTPSCSFGQNVNLEPSVSAVTVEPFAGLKDGTVENSSGKKLIPEFKSNRQTCVTQHIYNVMLNLIANKGVQHFPHIRTNKSVRNLLLEKLKSKKTPSQAFRYLLMWLENVE